MIPLTQTFPPFIILFSLLFSFTSCTVEQKITLEENLAGQWDSHSRIEPFVSVVFDNLASVGGYDNADVFYEEFLANFEKDLAQRPKMTLSHLTHDTQQTWSAGIGFNHIENFFPSTAGSEIIRLFEDKNSYTLHFHFTREQADQMQDFLPLLQHPVLSIFNPSLTGDFDEESYIKEVLGFVFGKENIPLIKASQFVLEIDLPGPITALSGGQKISPSLVRFEERLMGFLVPDEAIDWSVSWHKSR